MKVTYNGPHAAVDVPALGRRVELGEQVEAPDDVAAGLVEQGWAAEASDLGALTVAELRDVAAERGVELDSRATKAEIIAAIAADKEH